MERKENCQTLSDFLFRLCNLGNTIRNAHLSHILFATHLKMVAQRHAILISSTIAASLTPLHNATRSTLISWGKMKRSRPLWLLPTVALLVACGGSDGSQDQSERGVTIDLPPFEPEPVVNTPPASNEAALNEATELNVMVPAAAERETTAESAKLTPPPKADPPKPAPKPETAPPKTAAKAPAPPAKTPETAAKADTDAPKPAAARLPLSNERIAQTIQRIGYACGEVTGATAVEGEPVPTWRITCSSGDSYRGTNRGGNMRFRKLN